MNKKIIDHKSLLPDKNIILEVIKSHPLCQELYNHIETVVITEANKESIEYDYYHRKVVLNLSVNSYSKENFKYILFHEFSHIADKVRPAFKYSEELKTSLSDLEKLLVMELWNVYIDSRLNYYGLFMLGPNDKNVYGTINGKFQELPFSVEGKLCGHISFLTSGGFQDAEAVIESIWNNPGHNLSYVDLILIIKQGLVNTLINPTQINTGLTPPR